VTKANPTFQICGTLPFDLISSSLHNRFAGVGVRPESPQKGADDSYEGFLAAEESSAFFLLIPPARRTLFKKTAKDWLAGSCLRNRLANGVVQ